MIDDSIFGGGCLHHGAESNKVPKSFRSLPEEKTSEFQAEKTFPAEVKVIVSSQFSCSFFRLCIVELATGKI